MILSRLKGDPPEIPWQDVQRDDLIELILMNDAYAVPPGTRGIVNQVLRHDTLPIQISVTWETDHDLAIVPDEDQFRIISRPNGNS